MEKYVSRARSAFYPNATVDAKVKTFFTLELFQLACQMDLDAGRAWQAKLAGISNASIQNVIAQIPTALMSDIAREFTEKLLKTNMNRLASLDIQ